MAINLSEGCIKGLIIDKKDATTLGHPTVQIIAIKKVSKNHEVERYRINISDGVHFLSSGVLASQLNAKVDSGDLVENTIITLKHTINSSIKGKDGSGDKNILIILDCEVVVPGSEVNERIGNPTPLTDRDQAAPAASKKENGDTNHAPPVKPTAAPQPAEESKPQPPKPSLLRDTSPAGQPTTKKPRLDMNTNGHNIRPIDSINPFQNKWVIKARVMSKPPVKTWQNDRGEGKLFSMELKDSSGEIRATAFKEEVDKFYNQISEGKVYLIGNCTVKTANKKFSSLKHDYELTFNRETFVSEVADDSSVPVMDFSHVPIESLKTVGVGTILDVIAVCHQASDVQTIMSRANNRELKKREITLVDDTNHSVCLTLWGEQAENFDGSSNPVIGLRNAFVKEFQGNKNLSTGFSTTIVINPDIQIAHHLKGWYENQGSQLVFNTVGDGAAGGSRMGNDPWKNLICLKEEQLGNNDKPDYIGVVAHVMALKKENCYYLACPKPECKKKVMDNGAGIFHCEKCNYDYNDYNPRLILNVNVADWTSNTWVTLFDDEGKQLLGITDNKAFVEMKTESPNEFNALFDAARFKRLQLKLRIKMELYNDEKRIRASVVKMEELDLVQHNTRLLSEIAQMRGVLGI